jgi:3',5'-nucleoside bisphosphate phosphatase
MNDSYSADLHLHSHWSFDGEQSVEEVFAYAKERQLKAIALTEHHTLDSAAEASQVALRYLGIRYVRSAEITVTCSIGKVDLLCYGFPNVLPASLKSILEEYRCWQREYATGIVRGVQALGLQYTSDDHVRLVSSFRYAPAVNVQGMTHVCNERWKNHFLQRGFIRSEEEYAPFMEQVRMKGKPPHIPCVDRVLPAIKQAGVLIFIAHPVRYFKICNQSRMDQLREELSLDGVECIHPAVTPELSRSYRAYCIRHKLLSSGGSDCHNASQRGRYLGRFGTPEEWWREIAGRLLW